MAKQLTQLQRILMKRDGLSLEEANDLIDECREELECGNYDAIEDLLGLEPDYIFDII